MSVKIKVPANISLKQAVSELGSNVELSDGNIYGCLPYWIKLTGESNEGDSEPIGFEFFHLDQLPEELRQQILSLRK